MLTPGQIELRKELDKLKDPKDFLSFVKKLSENSIIINDKITGFNLYKHILDDKKTFNYQNYQEITFCNSYTFPSDRIKKFIYSRNNSMDKTPFAYEFGEKCDKALIYLDKLHKNNFFRSKDSEPIRGSFYIDSGTYRVGSGGNHRALIQWLYGGDMYVDELKIYELK